MTKELSELETYEVSLVPKGANGKKFLVFKNLKGKKSMSAAKELVDHVKNVDPEVLKKVQKIIKEHMESHQDEAPMSEKSKAALQAVVRILSPMKEELSPEVIHHVLQAAGINLGSPSEADKGKKMEEDDGDEDEEEGEDYEDLDKSEIFGNPDGEEHKPDGEPPAHERDSQELLSKDHMAAIPEDVLSDMKDVLKGEDASMDKIHGHLNKAMKYAMGAYKHYMSKLGYRKYPDAEMRMKDIKQVDVSEENHEHGEAQPMDKIHKQIDLSKVDPKSKAAFEAIFKANKEAVEKAEKLEKELKAQKDAARHKELVEKAEKLGVGAKTDELVAIMKSLPTDQLEKFESILKGAGEQIKKGKLFEELGTSSQGSLPGNDAYAKIETMAEALVTKSETKISKAEAIEAVLKTAEGQRLYGEYKGSRKDGI